MTLEADEFIRRFLLHVLPDGFQRIRHYGFLGHRYRQAKLALCRQLLGVVLPSAGLALAAGQTRLPRSLRKTDRQIPARLSGLPRWAYGGDRRPPRRRIGHRPSELHEMLTSQSVPPSLRLLPPSQQRGHVHGTKATTTFDAVGGFSALTHHVFLTTVTPHPRKNQQLHQYARPLLAPTSLAINRSLLPRTKDSIPIGPSLARGLVQPIFS